MDKGLNEFADAFAFLGNSLLAPMTQTERAGLQPEFWRAFPTFGSDDEVAATEALAQWAAEQDDAMTASEVGRGGLDAVTRCAVEYTRLFVGPPRPASPPWETMYRGGGHEMAVGFGRATFEMRELLRQAGLQVSNENNQYADHMGIELLLLSALCRRGEVAKAMDFAQEHPLSWIAAFRKKVRAAAPGGYFDRLLGLAEALLRSYSSMRSNRDAGAPQMGQV